MPTANTTQQCDYRQQCL